MLTRDNSNLRQKEQQSEKNLYALVKKAKNNIKDYTLKKSKYFAVTEYGIGPRPLAEAERDPCTIPALLPPKDEVLDKDSDGNYVVDLSKKCLKDAEEAAVDHEPPEYVKGLYGELLPEAEAILEASEEEIIEALDRAKGMLLGAEAAVAEASVYANGYKGPRCCGPNYKKILKKAKAQQQVVPLSTE